MKESQKFNRYLLNGKHLRTSHDFQYSTLEPLNKAEINLLDNHEATSGEPSHPS